MTKLLSPISSAVSQALKHLLDLAPKNPKTQLLIIASFLLGCGYGFSYIYLCLRSR